MKKHISITFLLMALTAILVTSCKKDSDVTSANGGEPTSLDVNFNLTDEVNTFLGEATPGTYSIDNPGVNTDEGTSAGYKPKDVWVIQYNGTTDDAVIIGLPRYVVVGTTTSVPAVTSSVPNTLVFVANTHDANIEWGNILTLGDLKKACKKISAEIDCYGNNYSSTNDLIMSGKYEGVISTGNITANLTRNIARIDFKLFNGAGSGMTLKSVQLCNVPRSFCWASSLIPTTTLYPALLDYMDYPAEDLTGAMNAGGNQTLTWYMPLNQRGVVAASTTQKTKPNYAPSYSTYIRILATDAQNVAYVYKIYPGANLKDDYNLLSNRKYTIKITINSAGDASTDGRIENYGLVDFESANSYILNPAPVGSDRVFTIPIDRVNEFWAGKTPDRTLKATTAWTAELLWQDTPESDFIRFVNLPGGTLSTTQNGVGPNQRIAVTTKTGYEGNALICIKVGGEIRWSWHLWVTDYDPTYTAAPVEGQYVYSVPGGNVHRYNGTYWRGTGMYKNKYIMDRNLGSTTTQYNMKNTLYYQFGRKDPQCSFGSNYSVLYDINGVDLNYNGNVMLAPYGVSIAESVLNPTIFYSKDATSNAGDWTNESKGSAYLWNGDVAGLDQKSFYDPCPPGWKIPVLGYWNDFIYEPSLNPSQSTCLNVARDPSFSWNYNLNNGVRYWPKNQEIVGEIYYPAHGSRHYSGSMATISTVAGCWSANALNDRLAYTPTALFSIMNVLNSVTCSKAYAYPIRCIQE